jgi:ferritin
MDVNLAQEFNKQINKELYSAYLYFAMSTYFAEISYDGFAKYMKEQAVEELGHAQKFYDFLLMRKAKISFDVIQPPEEVVWINPADVLEHALNHERFITSLIYNLYNGSQEVKDQASALFLQQFILEQAEEEYKMGTLLDKIKTLQECPCGLQSLNRELKTSSD